MRDFADATIKWTVCRLYFKGSISLRLIFN